MMCATLILYILYTTVYLAMELECGNGYNFQYIQIRAVKPYQVNRLTDLLFWLFFCLAI